MGDGGDKDGRVDRGEVELTTLQYMLCAVAAVGVAEAGPGMAKRVL